MMRRLKLAPWQPLSPSVIYQEEKVADLVIQWPEFTRNEGCIDHLTGIPNRKAYDLAISHAIKEAELQGSGFGFIILDIDYFKKVNDEHGHAAGDVVLKEFAGTVKGVLRESDFFARYGGEEFVLITPSHEQVFEIGERIRIVVLEQEFTTKKLTITCSFGCSRYPLDSTSAIELFEIADKALYQAKNNGRNQGFIGGID